MSNPTNAEQAVDWIRESAIRTGDWRNAEIAVEKAKVYAILAVADALAPPVRYMAGNDHLSAVGEVFHFPGDAS